MLGPWIKANWKWSNQRCKSEHRPFRNQWTKWTGMGDFHSDDHYIYYCGQESLRKNGVAIIVNKRVWNAVLGCSLKNSRMISVCFQGKWFNISVIQVYAPICNAEEAEVEWFSEDLAAMVTQKKSAYEREEMCFSKYGQAAATVPSGN